MLPYAVPYKLIYFNVRGLAESIRLLCADQGVDLVEENVTGESWTQLKPTMTFGQIPFFSDGDMELVQSNAILRYLARKHGLYGDNDKEKALIDMANDASIDIRMKYATMIYTNYEEGKDGYIKELPDHLEKFEKLLQKNNGGQGFFVGNKISFADYSMYNVFTCHEVLSPGCLDAFPCLKGFVQRMEKREGITKYLQTDGYKSRAINGNGKQ